MILAEFLASFWRVRRTLPTVFAARGDRTFPVVVVGFAAPTHQIQREQFLLVNRTKPLPRDLLIELLADVDVALPGSLEKLQLASRVVQILRREPASPFHTASAISASVGKARGSARRLSSRWFASAFVAEVRSTSG